VNRRRVMAVCIALVVVLTSMAAACAAAPSFPPGLPDEDFPDGVPSDPSPPIPTPTPAPSPPRDDLDDGEALPPDSAAERMVVRSGFMEIVVDDVGSTAQAVGRIAGTMGGYIVSSSVYQEGGRTFGSVVIRVSADRFDSSLSAIREMAVEVARETTSSTDVTEEYIDLAARKRNLERTEQQLLELMEQAGTVDELLNVQRELTRVRGEIEQLEARIRYLEQTSAMSLIEVFLREAVLSVSFSADTRVVDAGEPVQFTVDVSGGFAPYSYDWRFGDGETSNQASPSHTYRSEGWYSVWVTVMDDRGATATASRESYIQVRGVWSPADVFRDAIDGLGSVGRAALSVLIWFIVYLPLWAVLGGIAYLIYRRAMKGSQKNPSTNREGEG